MPRHLRDRFRSPSSPLPASTVRPEQVTASTRSTYVTEAVATGRRRSVRRPVY